MNKILISFIIFIFSVEVFCQSRRVSLSPQNHTSDSVLIEIPSQAHIFGNKPDTLYNFTFENNSTDGFQPIYQYSDIGIRWHRKKMGELFPTYSNTRYDEGTLTAINERDGLTRLEMISPTVIVSPLSNIGGIDYVIRIDHKIFNFENKIYYPARITIGFEDNGLKYDFFLSHDSPEIFDVILNREHDDQSWLNRPFRLSFYFIGQERGDFWCIKDIKILKIQHNEISHLSTGSGTSGPSGPR